ncbi:S8 family serine peptidase [Actinoplanes sp. NPDC051494]|uniref:S8 family serine peptidase n=1 Tax=Actinoplanes sp. NPDC051494 TaxID=3363907 RepID=UPI0037905254
MKYYVVAATYAGSPENLTEIAGRFLGSDARSTEIFNLNVGRAQPDQGVLADPARLTAGWRLIMPWDAVGPEIVYGPLSTADSAGTGAPPVVAAPAGTSCAGAASTTRVDWAQLRLAADLAWPHSSGKGQVVAVVDSGVNGKLPQLTGRVSPGRDMADDKSPGDSDCIGTGSSMAALITAHQIPGSELTGVAPDASVLPVRVAAGPAAVQPPNAQAQGIAYAVTSGAGIIALGPAVDAGAPEVAAALQEAVRNDVVVVLGAKAEDDKGEPPAGPGFIRVAGVSADLRGADTYRKGGVDVSAPGVNVTSLGVTASGGSAGNGTYYAVAFTAGQAALVRSAFPDLTAAQVAHRIEVTADQIGEGTLPDGSFGWGMINPGVSVTRALAEETAAAADEAPAPEPRRHTWLLVLVLVVIAAATTFLVRRIRRIWRGGDGDEHLSALPVQVHGPLVPVDAMSRRSDTAADRGDPAWAGPSTTGPAVPAAATSHWTDGDAEPVPGDKDW